MLPETPPEFSLLIKIGHNMTHRLTGSCKRTALHRAAERFTFDFKYCGNLHLSLPDHTSLGLKTVLKTEAVQQN